ncbi:hypothetical protein [Thiofilum flexile]|uniref:hypothetical protein n=1 Tax=Thiofilum flexile TaxID=125627 RepID=UPI00036CEF53|nr:hypothetical protein [Thiofilum flexile]
MENLRKSLITHLAVELGSNFLLNLEQDITAKYKAASDYNNAHVSKEMRPYLEGNMQHAHLVDVVVSCANNTGLNGSRTPTDPKGFYYARIISDRFVISCIRDKSTNWTRAKHKQELSKLNTVLEPVIEDLFEPSTRSNGVTKIFTVILVTANPLDQSLPDIYFAIPYTDLSNFHMKASLKELQLACIENSTTQPILDPLPSLKKRLGDIEAKNSQK